MYCSNCGKQVPDESKYCLHCGSIVNRLSADQDFANQEPIAEGTMRCIDCKAEFNEIYKQCPKCGSRNKITAKIGENLPKNIDTKKIKQAKVQCPSCGSTNNDKISLTNKIASGAVFGLFAINHIGKTFKCEHCGYKW